MANKVLTMTTGQRNFLSKHWLMSRKTPHAVNTVLKHEFSDDAILARQTVYRLSNKFDETGFVNNSLRSGTTKVSDNGRQ